MNEYKDQYKLTGNFVNDGFKLSTAISCIGREMRGLSQAFMVTGNEKLSNQFFDLEQELEVISDCIKELVGNETSRGLIEAQKGSANIFMACLAGAKIQKEVDGE